MKKAIKRPMKLQVEGYEVIEKKAKKSGNTGRVYVPKRWIGKKVKIILIG